jgi:hypothetical protein
VAFSKRTAVLRDRELIEHSFSKERETMSSNADGPAGDCESPNPLVKTISCGNVLLSIFENESQRNGAAKPYYTVKASRSYRAPDGNWNYTNSFHKSQLPQLIYACQKALQFIENVESDPPF